MTSQDVVAVVANALADCERKRDWAIARMRDLEKRLADLESPGKLPAGEVEDLHTRLIVAERELATAYETIRKVRALVDKANNMGPIHLKSNIRFVLDNIKLPEDTEAPIIEKRKRGRPPKQQQN